MTTHAKPLEWTGEATSAVRFLASMPTGNATLTARDLRSLLLNTGGIMMARGYLYDIRSQSLGAGVYRVTLRRKNHAYPVVAHRS